MIKFLALLIILQKKFLAKLKVHLYKLSFLRGVFSKNEEKNFQNYWILIYLCFEEPRRAKFYALTKIESKSVTGGAREAEQIHTCFKTL